MMIVKTRYIRSIAKSSSKAYDCIVQLKSISKMILFQKFLGILLQKRQAEVHLQKQIPALDYTIIRPGGLKDGVASAPILFG